MDYRRVRENMDMDYMEKYPYNVYASVALLDNKIVNYRVGGKPWETAYNITFRGQIDFKRIDEVVIESKGFVVTRKEEHEKAFNVDAVEWFRQWEVDEKFGGESPY